VLVADVFSSVSSAPLRWVLFAPRGVPRHRWLRVRAAQSLVRLSATKSDVVILRRSDQDRRRISTWSAARRPATSLVARPGSVESCSLIGNQVLRRHSEPDPTRIGEESLPDQPRGVPRHNRIAVLRLFLCGPRRLCGEFFSHHKCI